MRGVKVEQSMKDYCSNTSVCRRLFLLLIHMPPVNTVLCALAVISVIFIAHVMVVHCKMNIFYFLLHLHHVNCDHNVN